MDTEDHRQEVGPVGIQEAGIARTSYETGELVETRIKTIRFIRTGSGTGG